jgi:hypothetical protein
MSAGDKLKVFVNPADGSVAISGNSYNIMINNVEHDEHKRPAYRRESKHREQVTGDKEQVTGDRGPGDRGPGDRGSGDRGSGDRGSGDQDALCHVIDPICTVIDQEKDLPPSIEAKFALKHIAIVRFAPLTPVEVTANSFSSPWTPDSVLRPDNNSLWISSPGTEKKEWIMFRFNSNVLLASVFIILNMSNINEDIHIETSTDGTNWNVIHKFDPTRYVECSDAEEEVIYDPKLYTSKLCRFIRIASDKVNSYLNFNYVQFFGMKF